MTKKSKTRYVVWTSDLKRHYFKDDIALAEFYKKLKERDFPIKSGVTGCLDFVYYVYDPKLSIVNCRRWVYEPEYKKLIEEKFNNQKFNKSVKELVNG